MDYAKIVQLINGIGVTGLLALGLMGGLRGWYVFGPQHERMLKQKDDEAARTVAGKEARIAEIRADATAHLAALSAGYEARLKEKDEECERERQRGDRLEAYTDRLIDAAMEATVLATRAVNKKDGS